MVINFSSRECALAHVSEAEEEVIQMKNRDTKLFPTSEEAAQIKKKKIQVNLAKEKLKNKRTLFVGNLPVSYTAQVSNFDRRLFVLSLKQQIILSIF